MASLAGGLGQPALHARRQEALAVLARLVEMARG